MAVSLWLRLPGCVSIAACVSLSTFARVSVGVCMRLKRPMHPPSGRQNSRTAGQHHDLTSDVCRSCERHDPPSRMPNQEHQ
ncbi:hypothetical protein M433DRAFT_161262 [Acidomyces richmondensis BFW]|nr:hypothetical protein M433DRAFT_161262 [Acidomyces richmondensis BFW]